MAGRYDQRKGGRQQGRGGPESEEQQDAKDLGAVEEHSRLQDQVGNERLAALLSGSSLGAEIAADGQGAELMEREEEGLEAPEFGGDEPNDPGPATIEELTRSWNTGIKKSEERAAVAVLPEEVLPPEDQVFCAAIAERVGGDVPEARGEPSRAAALMRMDSWIRAVVVWAGRSPRWRAIAWTALSSPGALQDPHGRPLFGRARRLALAQLLFAEVTADWSEARTQSVWSLAEIAARRTRAEAVRRVAAQSGEALPLAAAVFAAQAPAVVATEAGTPKVPWAVATRAVLETLVDPETATACVPGSFEVDDGVDLDDPLGLDAIVASMTSGGDHEAQARHEVVQCAERMAGVAVRIRVGVAAAAVAVADALARQPVVVQDAITTALTALDGEVQKGLELLVDVARAAQQKTVAPAGLRNGLKKAARQLDRAREVAMVALTAAVTTTLQDSPPPFSPPPSDALTRALAAERPGDLVAGLMKDGNPEMRDAALWVRAVAGMSGKPAAWEASRAALSGRAALAVGVALSAELLAVDRFDAVLALAGDQARVAEDVGAGVVLAEAALGEVDALARSGKVADALRTRIERGVQLSRMGSEVGVTILARWGLPVEEEDG